MSLARLGRTISVSLIASGLFGCGPGSDLPASEDAVVDEAGLTGELPVGTTLVTTGDVNLRAGPSIGEAIFLVVSKGETVGVVAPAPSNGFYRVEHDGTAGWMSGKYLEVAGPAQPVAGGEVWKFHASTLSIDLAVFVPAAAATAEEVDVLVYAHGLNVCAPVATQPPVSFVTDAPFSLAEIVAAAERPVVLALPFLDWEHLAANGMAFDGKKHRLGIPKNLNGVVAEVLEQVGEHRGASAPSLSHLYLAGHSRAYDFLNPLAAAHADPQMSSGALARLSRVWAFDTTYSCPSMSSWSSWIASKPELEVRVYYRNVSGTSGCGHAFEGIAAASDGRLAVKVAGESHCAVPGKRLPALLDGLP